MLEPNGTNAGGTGAANNDGESNSSNSGNGENGNATGGNNTSKTLSFEEFMKLEGNQAELDRRINKGIETAVKNERERLEALHSDKLTEVEKLAKMNEAEKAQYLADKKAKEMAEREANITKRELSAEAKETLASKGLPMELSEIVSYKDAESCKSSIDKIEDVFKKAVEKAVENKLKGDKPPKDASTNSNNSNSIDAQIKAAMGIRTGGNK